MTGPNACDEYVFGQFYASLPRYLAYLGLVRPGTPSYYNWFAPYHVYSYDSRSAGNNIFYSMTTIGTFPFDFTTGAFPSDCNIPTTSSVSEKTV